VTNGVPVSRFYTIVVIVGLLGYAAGYYTGEKGEQVSVLQDIVAQQQRDSEVIGEIYHDYNNITASEFLLD